MYRLVTPADLRALLDGNAPPAVVDLRDEAAFVAGHLPGAVLVPSGVIVERWVPQRLPTTGEVLLYDGGDDDDRASHEASHLSHLWYHGILVLAGGFRAWADADLPVEEGLPVDPLGVGRHIAAREPAPGVVPDEYAPKD